MVLCGEFMFFIQGLSHLCWVLLLGTFVCYGEQIDHSVEHVQNLNNVSKYSEETDDFHHMYLDHGTTALEHASQIRSHRAAAVFHADEVKRYRKHLEEYQKITKNSSIKPRLHGYYRKLIEKTKNLIEHYVKIEKLHKKLQNSHDNLGQHNLEVAEHSVNLREVTKQTSQTHQDIAAIHKKISQSTTGVN